MIKIYDPSVSFEDIWNFRPEDSSTHTAVPIINVVAEALYSTNVIECGEIAKQMHVDSRLLNAVIKVETGMSFSELLHQYRFRQVTEYVATNPDVKLDIVAKKFGYSSYSSLWRFMQRIGGVTPNGEKSQAGPELWLTWREEAKRKRHPYRYNNNDTKA